MNDLINVVEWSRWQFALTAIYHWLFVPLTLGLSVIVAVMESVYLKTKDEKWLACTKFWMTLFGINFAIGVATGLILEFEFGTNWSNYSWFVGDILGPPLAIEGILAFFMEATFFARNVLRLETCKPEVPSGRDMAYCDRRVHLRPLDPCSQRMDAVSRRNAVRSGTDTQCDG